MSYIQVDSVSKEGKKVKEKNTDMLSCCPLVGKTP